jgi:hypothetical protein
VETIQAVGAFFDRAIIEPCQYDFLATNTTVFLPVLRALAFAIVGGVVTSAGDSATTDFDLLPFAFSSVAAKTRLIAWVRTVGGLIPKPTPFETLSIPLDFVKHLIDMFVIPGKQEKILDL